METNHRMGVLPPHVALKPSLVEWKRNQALSKQLLGLVLETFLGGMETGDCPGAGRYHVRLETFLGGMETGADRGRRGDRTGLETFLSGMETKGYGSLQPDAGDLETFLSGMETLVGIEAVVRALGDLETFLGGMETVRMVGNSVCPPVALKPSLVEWKRIHRALKNETQNALKPSLVEWKLVSAAARALARRPP